MTAVIYARYSSDNQREESIEGQIRECTAYAEKNGITNMLNAIQMGILTSSTKERLEALEEQRKELQARIAEERLAKPKMKEEFVRFWLLRFRKLDMTQPEQRQALVDTFINAIYLYTTSYQAVGIYARGPTEVDDDITFRRVMKDSRFSMKKVGRSADTTSCFFQTQE